MGATDCRNPKETTMLDNLLNWFIDRIKEPSTHATLASLFGVLGIGATEGTISAVSLGIAALFVALGIGVKEAKK